MKLDVEGTECDVIADLASSGALSRLERLTLEYHHHVVAEEDRLGEVLSTLEQHNFGYSLESGPACLAPGYRQYFIIRAYAKSGKVSGRASSPTSFATSTH